MTTKTNLPVIHIACNIDGNFTKHCAVTLVSLFENNPAATFCIHIVANHLPAADQQALRDIVARYGGTICFYFPPADLLAVFSIKKFGKRISMATYYRCMLSAILPDTVDKVLYLDCDIVVLGDITPFWQTDLTGVGVACVEDIGCHETERYEVLHYPAADSYFNAGVLLINLDYWRRRQMDKQCVDYFRTYPERIRFNDQDLLNALLHDHKRFVPRMWNMQDGFYRYGMDTASPDPVAYRDELRHPVILHYTNKKPWNYDSMHPLKQAYYVYLDLTPWRGERPWKNPRTAVMRAFKFLPYLLGLRRAKYLKL